MGTRKRLLYFVLLNIVVSALTTWIVASIFLKGYVPSSEVPAADTVQTGSDIASDQSGDLSANLPETTQTSSEHVDVPVGQLEIDTVIGAGDLDTEHVMIHHVGDQEVMLLGWQLRDEDGHVFNFPALTMFSGGSVTVYTKAGTNNVAEMYWGLSEAIWSEGESVYLVDPNGDVQAVFKVP